MNETTIILPSSRAIRHELFKIDKQTLFLPNYITMGEFISKLCVVKDFKPIDDDSRILLLLKASEFKSFESLQIQRNFFTFTKNSSYIFKFFEELANEKYEIDNLATNDIYAEFEEHIEILQELYKRYEKLCLKQKILDKIFLPKLYEFNLSYAKEHKNIEIYVDGHLTNFEFELLMKCREYCEINIVFKTSRFNIKMQSKFLDLGIELEQDYKYLISLNKNEIIKKEIIIQNSNISCFSFSEQLLQVAFVKQKIYEYIKKGYEAQNIAVILPDEKFATLLRAFDKKSNFNFAMGEPFNQTKLYEKLNATSKEIEQDSKENKARLDRVGDEFYKSLIEIYYKNVSEVNLLEFLS
ncbi:MAG: PD-(D/E)XK nuclease family protein, partial [Sulfurimonas sp.]|nr:PD-(D/E)XK nuclease family protein [Sulfurimonas sp.]